MPRLVLISVTLFGAMSAVSRAKADVPGNVACDAPTTCDYCETVQPDYDDCVAKAKAKGLAQVSCSDKREGTVYYFCPPGTKVEKTGGGCAISSFPDPNVGFTGGMSIAFIVGALTYRRLRRA